MQGAIMRHLRLFGPFAMSVDTAIPDRFWPAIRWAFTYVFSWALPLVAIEKFADDHSFTGALLSCLTLIDWAVAAKWDQIEQLINQWRRRLAGWWA